MKFAKIGSISYVLWGLLHIIGGIAILASLSDGIAVGYGIFRRSGGDYSPLAGGILGFYAFNILWIGLLVAIVAIKLNWQNNRVGFYINLALAGFTVLGMIIFLLNPGFVTWLDASPSIILLIVAFLSSVLGLRNSKIVVAENGGAS